MRAGGAIEGAASYELARTKAYCPRLESRSTCRLLSIAHEPKRDRKLSPSKSCELTDPMLAVTFVMVRPPTRNSLSMKRELFSLDPSASKYSALPIKSSEEIVPARASVIATSAVTTTSDAPLSMTKSSVIVPFRRTGTTKTPPSFLRGTSAGPSASVLDPLLSGTCTATIPVPEHSHLYSR